MDISAGDIALGKLLISQGFCPPTIYIAVVGGDGKADFLIWDGGGGRLAPFFIENRGCPTYRYQVPIYSLMYTPNEKIREIQWQPPAQRAVGSERTRDKLTIETGKFY